ncbi:lecithin retinol acyltransferase [Catovirus CTV1]|uniref:Lecithin retinol acyltransferase n=1 Tax=Catovirus CTV1 TaxID=1977631 RepID=A0A1V0S9E3_9VIRU|nr:lecithin retinol acyltransferase [Catovirus CTV1]
MNFYRIQLNQTAFSEDYKDVEYNPSDFLEKYSWIIRKFEDPIIMDLGIMHHGYVWNNTDNIEIIEYGCETELKKDAIIQKTPLTNFLKSSQDYQFYVFKYHSDHKQEDEQIIEKTFKRMGEKKYSFLTNTCEDLCIDILIKRDYMNQYRNQILYMLDYPLFRNPEKFYKEKSDLDLEILKKFIPCKFDPQTNKILTYKNPLSVS